MFRPDSTFRLFIPLRALQTEATSSAAPTFPPPGFDPKQASKPPVQQQPKPAQRKGASMLEKEETIVPKTGATAHPKTSAQDVQTMAELAVNKATATTNEEKKAIAKKGEDNKLTFWQKVKREAAHYWDGTKLLGFEIRISSKLALKMAAGYELTRRERRQVGSSIDPRQPPTDSMAAPTHSERSWSLDPLPAVRHRSLCGTPAPGGPETFPQHAP